MFREQVHVKVSNKKCSHGVIGNERDGGGRGGGGGGGGMRELVIAENIST